MRAEDLRREVDVQRLDNDETYETIDEAIAAALSELEPGGRLDIHEEHCESDDGGDDCTCEPMTLVKGASA
jgi:hypothetical protein